MTSSTEKNTTESAFLGGYWGNLLKCAKDGPISCATQIFSRVFLDQASLATYSGLSYASGLAFGGHLTGKFEETSIDYGEQVIPALVATGSAYLSYSHLNTAGRAALGLEMEKPQVRLVTIHESTGEKIVRETIRKPSPQGLNRLAVVVTEAVMGISWGAVAGMTVYGGYLSFQATEIPDGSEL